MAAGAAAGAGCAASSSGSWALWQRGARLAARVGGRVDLRELRRPRHALLVAARAQQLRVGLHRLALGGVGGVLRERAVARLAAHVAVLAALQRLPHVGVALDARGAPGVGERPRAVVIEGAGTVVPVRTEALGHQQRLQGQEDQDARGEQGSHPHEVLLVAEETSHCSPPKTLATPSTPGWKIQMCRTNRGDRTGCDDRKVQAAVPEPNGSCRTDQTCQSTRIL